MATIYPTMFCVLPCTCQIRNPSHMQINLELHSSTRHPPYLSPKCASPLGDTEYNLPGVEWGKERLQV